MTEQDLLAARSLVIDILGQELNATRNAVEMLIDKVSKLELALKNENTVKNNLQVRLDDARNKISDLERERDGALR